jgi:8-oxo-dGTP pyrophosphatase MutT (NUDIX family)
MPPPPFQVLARQSVARNTRFDLRFDHLRTDQGEEIPRYLVVDPLNQIEGCTGVAVLPVVEGRLLLQRVYRHPVSRWGWEVPRGFVEPGETVAEGALRELLEETGLRCAPAALWPLGELSPEPGVINARILLFAATECREEAESRQPELGCGDERRLFEPEAAAAMAGSPEFSCATSLVCFYRYRDLRARLG